MKVKQIFIVISFLIITSCSPKLKLTGKLVTGNLKAQNHTKYHAMLVFDKSAYFPGERLTGKIFLGKKDSSVIAEKVIIDGMLLPKNKIKAGHVILDRIAGSIGDKEMKGEFYFKKDNSIIKLPIKGSYYVIPKPTGVIISTKENVVYRGISNPLIISIPGVSPHLISATGPGLSKLSYNKYEIKPSHEKSVKIRVIGRLRDCKILSSNKVFEIKDIPPACGMINDQYGTISLPKLSLANVIIDVDVPDFLFDLKLQVSSFTIKVPGNIPVKVSGERMNESAMKAISKAKVGDYIIINEIKVNLANGYPIKRVFPLIIKVIN